MTVARSMAATGGSPFDPGEILKLGSFILKGLFSSIDPNPELKDLLEAVLGGDHVVQLGGCFTIDDSLESFNIFLLSEIILHSIFL